MIYDHLGQRAVPRYSGCWVLGFASGAETTLPSANYPCANPFAQKTVDELRQTASQWIAATAGSKNPIVRVRAYVKSAAGWRLLVEVPSRG